MALKSVKYIGFDDQKGALYSAGKQSLLIPVTFIKAIDSAFVQLVGIKGANILIYKIGEALGREYTQTLEVILKKEKTKLSPEMKIRMNYNAIFMQAGWGKVKIQKIDLVKKVLEVKLTYSPSGEFLKKSRYNLERGVIAGVYKEIVKEEVYCQLLKKDRKKHTVILSTIKEVPEEIKAKERLVLFTRKELEQKIKKTTSALEEAKTTLEIKVKARTKELEEIAKNLDEIVKERTKKIEKKTEELGKSRTALMNILEDVEDARKRAEREKNRTSAIITNFSDGLLVFDKKNNLSLINPQAEKFFKVKSEKIIGKTFLELKKIPQISLLVNLLGEEIKGIFRKELKFEERLILEVSTVSILREGEEPGSLVILHDITREKLIEKMKSEFVSISAHQLRTPLSAIKWTLKMLLDEDLGKITEEQRNFIKKTYTSNERMINLINALLDVTRIEEGRFLYKLTSTQIEDVVQFVLNSYKEQTEKKKIRIEFKKPKEKTPQVIIDVEKIKLAIQNLLDNALRYTFVGGKVTISINYDKKKIEFSIKDTGIGIPKEQQKRVFNKFFRATNVMRIDTEGTGLGLFITKNIIEAHKGKIWFESEENKGTTFYFSLPIKK